MNLDHLVTEAYERTRAEMAGKFPPLTETMRRWEAEQALLRRDPVLAILLRIEAIADHRAENHVCAASKLAMIVELARKAAEAHTGRPFRNPLFP